MCLGVELSDIELAQIKIVLIVPYKRSIGTNHVATARLGNSFPVEEASNCENSTIGEMKLGINLTIVNQFHLVSCIGIDIHALNLRKNPNELPGVLAILNVPTASFAQLLQSVVPKDYQPTLVWSCIAMYNLWELASLTSNST